MSFTLNQIKTIFKNLHVDKNKNHYTCGLAPHKPILLLSILLLKENDRVDLENIKIDLYLRETWSELWSCLDYPHPGPIYLPFYHMKSEGFWHIEYNEQVSRGQPKSVKQINKRIKRVYLDSSIITFFKEEKTREELINTLLNAGYFSDQEIQNLTQKIKEIDDSFIYQEKLQKLVDTEFRERPLIEYPGLTPSRNPAFRRIVLDAYNETCTICHMKLENSLGISVIDAAHILPFSQFYNDDVRNGLSLCKLHHWLFDHGLITVNTDYTIRVSNKIDYEFPKKLISSFHNQKIQLPENKHNQPSPVALKWHQKNVFE